MSKVTSLVQRDERARIVAGLRSMAKDFEEGRADPHTVIVIVDSRGTADVDIITLGHRPRLSDSLGMFEFAKIATYAAGTDDA